MPGAPSFARTATHDRRRSGPSLTGMRATHERVGRVRPFGNFRRAPDDNQGRAGFAGPAGSSRGRVSCRLREGLWCWMRRLLWVRSTVVLAATVVGVFGL